MERVAFRFFVAPQHVIQQSEGMLSPSKGKSKSGRGGGRGRGGRHGKGASRSAAATATTAVSAAQAAVNVAPPSAVSSADAAQRDRLMAEATGRAGVHAVESSAAEPPREMGAAAPLSAADSNAALGEGNAEGQRGTRGVPAGGQPEDGGGGKGGSEGVREGGTAGAGGTSEQKPEGDAGGGRTTRASASASANASVLEVGSRVMCRWRDGQMHPAKVIERRRSSERQGEMEYYMHYLECE